MFKYLNSYLNKFEHFLVQANTINPKIQINNNTWIEARRELEKVTDRITWFRTKQSSKKEERNSMGLILKNQIQR